MRLTPIHGPTDDSDPRHGWRDYGPAALLLLIGLIGLTIATLAPTGKGDQYAVVAPPWYSLGQTIALVQDAKGAIIDMGGPANMVIVHSKDPAFISALYSKGAWLVIDPMRLRGCIGFRPVADGRVVADGDSA